MRRALDTFPYLFMGNQEGGWKEEEGGTRISEAAILNTA